MFYNKNLCQKTKCKRKKTGLSKGVSSPGSVLGTKLWQAGIWQRHHDKRHDPFFVPAPWFIAIALHPRGSSDCGPARYGPSWLPVVFKALIRHRKGVRWKGDEHGPYRQAQHPAESNRINRKDPNKHACSERPTTPRIHLFPHIRPHTFILAANGYPQRIRMNIFNQDPQSISVK